MKSTNTSLKLVAYFMLATLAIFLNTTITHAQGCNQVEIKYDEPDCYKHSSSSGAVGNDRGCTYVTVCEKQRYTYSATGGPWASHLWAITSGPATPSINPNATVADVAITWPMPGTYTLSLTVTDGSGNSFTKCIQVTVKEKPLAAFTFSPNNACAGSTVTFVNGTSYSGTANYSWDFGDPSSNDNTSSQANPTHQFAAPGTYTVTLVAYSSVLVPNNSPKGDAMTLVTCCADTVKHTVTVANGNVKIECVSTVCSGTKATYTAVGCSTAIWGTPVGGTTLSSTGNTITVLWGSGTPQGQLSVSCGSCTAYVTVPIIPSTPVILGNTSPCASASSSYSLPLLPGTFYTWTLTDVTAGNVNVNSLLSTYPDNNTVWIDWPSAIAGNTHTLTVTLNNPHLCCTSTASISIKPKQIFSINGPPSICAGQTASFFPNQADTFFWTASPMIGVVPPIAGGANFYSATFNIPGNYVITASNSTAYCNTTASANAIVVPVPVPDTIVGPVVACAGSQYTYTMSGPAPAGYFYEWLVTNGNFPPTGPTVTTGNSAIVLWTSLPGTLTVTLKQSSAPFCNIPADFITVNAATAGSVSGPDSVCVDGTGTYTLTGGNTPAGTIVNWSISPASLGTIMSGQGTGTITILWHGQGGSGPWGPATVNATTGCGPAGASAPITIFPKFNISISTSGVDICQSGGLSLTANGAPINAIYAWTPGAANTQTITNITTPGTYTVLATAGGCSDAEQIQIEDPFAIVPLTCGVGVCNGTNTNELLGVKVIKPGTGTFTYEWHSGTCTSPGSLLATTTTGTTTNNFTAPADGNYYAIVKYGNCQKCVNFTVKKVCCPDVNIPTVVGTQNTCNQYTFVGTTPNPTGAIITWNFGDGTTDTGSSLTPKQHTYLNAGIYCVTFCVDSPAINPTHCTGNCAVTQAIVPIAPAFTYTMGCNGCLNVNNLTAVYDNTGIVNYLWDFGDATTSTLHSPPAHCYTSGGTYNVQLTVTWAKGTITCSKTVAQSVIYTPLAITVSDTCTASPITFSSTPGGFSTYTWAFGDGFTGYISPIYHAYNTAGTYQVTLSVLDALGNICKDTSTLNILTGIANCSIQPGYICPGQFATLVGPVGTYSYLWLVETSPNVFAPAPGINNIANYSTNQVGNYQVVVTNANGCKCSSNVVSVTTVANPKANFTISPSKNLCAPGGTVLLNAPLITGYNYKWYINGSYGAPVSTGPTFFVPTVTSTTTFNLIVTNQYGCRDTCSMVVTVATPPAQPTITTTGFCEGIPITLAVTNWSNNITWNNGDTSTTIVVYNAGTYIATYTDTLTGCTSSNKITINKRPSAGLFPHSCDSIPCKCSRPFVIYAPTPLIGSYASTYTIDWYNAITNTYLASGPTYSNGGFGIQTGSYYIVITDATSGCIDTSNSYSVVVPPCDTCGCSESYFGEMVLTPLNNPIGSNSGVVVLICDSTHTVACNKPYTLKPYFHCKDSACKSKITYTIQPPSGPAITGSDSVNFMPTLSGIYTLTIYGWCGNNPCDTCVIKLNVKCPDCDCKGSKWGPLVLSQNNDNADPAKSTAVIGNPATLKCGKTYKIDCNKPYSLNATYLCKDTACNGKVTYSLLPPAGSAITGTGAVNFTPTISGTYILTLYGWCGGVKCDSCVVKFVVVCGCDCAESKWTEIVLSQGGIVDSPDPAIVGQASQKLKCDKIYNLDCSKPYSINAGFFCTDTACPSKITYSFNPPVGTPVTGTLPLNLTPVLSGTYSLTLYGWCGNKICDSCVIRFKVDCECDCKGAKWIEKTLNNGTTTTALACKPYEWKCNLPVNINAAYACAKGYCTDTSTYKLIPPSGPVVTGYLPLSFTPSVSGTYTVVIYGYCGTKLCDSCVSSFKVDCPKDTTCCRYPIRVIPGAPAFSLTPSGNATIVGQSFNISGLTGVQLTEVRAEVISYNMSSNYNDECIACKTLPFLWASINSAASIGAVPALINLYGGSTTTLFNPTGTAVYQNPREVVWNNGGTFTIVSPIGIKFFLPPPPVIDCCELKGKICVKFTFRDTNCNECEVITCFDVVVSKK
jgi:PKD repeat protein